MPPENAKALTDLALRFETPWRLLRPIFQVNDIRLKTELYGINITNPIGVAAGFDKNCRMIPCLESIGFGYVTGGTITTEMRSGNQKPRLLRLVNEQSLINSLGFPNMGLEHAYRNIEKAQGKVNLPIVTSVSGTNIDEIAECYRVVKPQSDAIEINISSPNTPGLRIFHDPKVLSELLAKINCDKDKPLVIKLPPYSNDTNSDQPQEPSELVLELIKVCQENQVDGLTVSNSMPIRNSKLSTGTGGISGKSLFKNMLKMVTEIREEVGASITINACGGIFTGMDAWQALQAGANTIQLYTGMVYRGPQIVRKISLELLFVMEKERVDSLNFAHIENSYPADNTTTPIDRNQKHLI